MTELPHRRGVIVGLGAVALLAGAAVVRAGGPPRLVQVPPPGLPAGAPAPLGYAILPEVPGTETEADGAAPPPAAADAGHVPGRLVVRCTAALAQGLDRVAARAATTTGDPALDALNRRHGLRGVRAPFAGRAARLARRSGRFPARAARAPRGAVAPDLEEIRYLEVSPYLDMEAVAREYARVPGVVWAEPDRLVRAVLVPNDRYFGSSGAWGQPFRDLWGLEQIDAPAAWDVTRGAGVVVAITDTGIDTGHPDLAGRIWTNAGEVPGNGVDDDDNGYVDDVGGWDFHNIDADAFDDHGHGTHVGGTVAAAGQNALGVVGVAFEATLMPLKMLSGGGSGSFTAGAESIVYAADNGADVVNASWGGAGGSAYVADALAAADAAGVVVVAAAGNSSADVGNFSPANDPHVITVSAFDHTDTIAWFSNFGTKIDVAAPGGGGDEPPTASEPYRSILSLRSSAAYAPDWPSYLTVGGIYARQAGTSMAAPHVAGGAALVLARYPGATVEQVRTVLRSSADDVDAPGVDPNSGYGRLNVDRAVRYGSVLAVRITSPAPNERVGGVVAVRGTVSGPGFASYVLEYAPAPVGPAGPWLPIGGPFTTPVEGGDLGTWDISTLVDGDYVLRVRAATTGGDTFDDRVTIAIDNAILTSPVLEDIVGAGGAPVEIRGTAAGVGFERFRVEYRMIGPDLVVGPWISAGVTLTGGGTAPVVDGVLATLDPQALPAARDIDIRLTVDAGSAAGSFLDEVRHVVVDPTLRPGWPRRIPGLPSSYPRPKHHVVIADLDADGTKEVLAAWGDLVFAFRHDGTDLPGWPQSATTPGDDTTRVDTAPTAADLDGDGRLEVVAANYEEIFIWHDDGTPLAGWPKAISDEPYPGWRYSPTGDIVLTDLDGDGARDLVFRLGRALAAVRVSDGTYLPGFPVRKDCYLLSPACFEGAVAVGDATGDGVKEIAIIENTLYGHGRQYLHLYDNQGRLLPGFPVKMTSRFRYGSVSGFGVPVMADVDGDGALDIALNTDKAKRIRVYSSDGRKVRTQPAKLPQHILEYGAPIGKFYSDQEPLSAADLNGDGRAEILVGSDFPAVRRKGNSWWFLLPPYSGTDYLSVVTGGDVPLAGWPIALSYPRADKAHGAGTAVVGDLDGDGRHDVVTGTGICQYWGSYTDPTLHRCYGIYAFDRNGALLPGFPKPVPTPSPQLGNSVAIGDLDGDGLKEIVFLDYKGNVIVWTVPGTPGPERMQWPMIRHDPAGTSALVANP
jgi:subtilisin family serine protease